MKKELTQIERLDLAARAEVAESFFPQRQVLFAILSALFIVLAVESTASSFETLLVRVVAALTTGTTIMLLLRWRYALHIAAAVFFAVAIGMALLRILDPSVLSSWALGYVLVFVSTGFRFWKPAVPLAAVQGKGWKKEKSQVQQWLKMLENLGTEEQVFEISSGSFWTGYFTHRLLKRGDYWAIATWPKHYRRFADYRVFGSHAVRITELPGGALNIEIEKRRLGRVAVSPDVHDALLGVARPQ